VLQTKTLSITATIHTGFDPSLGAYRNSSQVLASNSLDPDSTPGDNSTTQDDDATATPLISDLSVTKSVTLADGGDADNSGGLSGGDTVVFTIAVTNSGPDLATAASMQIRDVIPAGYTYQSNDGGATYDDPTDTVTWEPGAIGTLTPKVLHITARMEPGYNPLDGHYDNYVQVSGADNFDPDSTPGNDGTAEDDGALARPAMADLSVTKSVEFSQLPFGDLDGSGSITLGDIVSFSLTVANAGPDTATGVVVTDQLPAGYEYVGDSSGGTYDFNTGLWSVGAVAADSSVSITIRAEVVAETDLTNIAEITASETYDPDSTPNNHLTTEDDYFSVTPTLGQAADLELTKVISQIIDADNSGGLNAGDQVVFTLTLSNETGPSDVASVVVKDQLPDGYTYVSHTGDGTYDSGTGLWTLADVLVGETRTLNITAAIVSGLDSSTGAYDNYAQIWTSGIWDPDSTPGDGSTTDDDDATAALQIADLSITKTDGRTTAVPGQTVTYTIVVSNAGPATAAGAQVIDTVPATLTGVTYTSLATGGATGNTASGNGSLNDTVTLPAGSAIIYTVTGTVSAGATGTLTNTAQVISPPTIPDLDPGDNSVTDTDTLTPRADLRIFKTDGLTTVTAGSTVTYTVGVDNTGPSNVIGAVIEDLFPAGLIDVTYTSTAAGGATGNTPSGSGNIQDTVNVPVNGVIIYVVTGTVDPTATGQLANTATISPPPGVTDTDPTNNAATDTDTVTAPPTADLSMAKSV
ncbi:MAG: DUF11 domain-containing protein, partial [Candidatus Anammoximicrobium sp.]|nr:DUF11 domain-containing protein [Candidatus Anammoximicrobium sp.]